MSAARGAPRRERSRGRGTPLPRSRGRRAGAASRAARPATASPRSRRRARNAARTTARRAPARRSPRPGRRPSAAPAPRTRIARGTSDGVRAREAGAPSAARDTRREREQEERPRLVAPRSRDAQQPTITAVSSAIAIAEQRAAWKAVGQMPGRQGQERQRDEHRQPDETEVERVAPDGVHLPADRDERHLDREARREHDAEEEHEVAVPERRIAAPTGSRRPVYAASPSSPARSGAGRNSTSSRWILEPSTSSTVKRRPSDRTSSPGSAARPIRSKTKPATVW